MEQQGVGNGQRGTAYVVVCLVVGAAGVWLMGRRDSPHEAAVVILGIYAVISVVKGLLRRQRARDAHQVPEPWPWWVSTVIYLAGLVTILVVQWLHLPVGAVGAGMVAMALGGLVFAWSGRRGGEGRR